MKIRNTFIEFSIRFIIAIVVSVIVSYLYSSLVHGAGLVDWDFCVRIAAILAVVVTISRGIEAKKNEEAFKAHLRSDA